MFTDRNIVSRRFRPKSLRSRGPKLISSSLLSRQANQFPRRRENEATTVVTYALEEVSVPLLWSEGELIKLV